MIIGTLSFSVHSSRHSRRLWKRHRQLRSGFLRSRHPREFVVIVRTFCAVCKKWICAWTRVSYQRIMLESPNRKEVTQGRGSFANRLNPPWIYTGRQTAVGSGQVVVVKTPKDRAFYDLNMPNRAYCKNTYENMKTWEHEKTKKYNCFINDMQNEKLIWNTWRMTDHAD